MSQSDEEQEVFEIVDYTNTSDWERFIANLETVIHEWNLTSSENHTPLQKDELVSAKWEIQTAELRFKHLYLILTRHYVIREAESEGTARPSVSEVPQQPPFSACLQDIMEIKNDFPARAHCITRWYGYQDFLILSPAPSMHAITDPNLSKFFINSIGIAFENSHCFVPIFVQLHEFQRRLYKGICHWRNTRTMLDMVHLRQAPYNCNHLAGLLNLFKKKLACAVLPTVTIAIRFSYLFSDCYQSGGDTVPVKSFKKVEEMFPADYAGMPFGGGEEQIMVMQLFVTWPSVAEDTVVDNDVHSTLDPLQAPCWSVRSRINSNCICLLGNFINSLYNAMDPLLCKDELHASASVDSDEQDPLRDSVLNALEKLSQPSPLSSLQNIVSQAKFLPYAEDNKKAPFEQEILINMLKFIFPDTASISEMDKVENAFYSNMAVENSISFQNKFSNIKTAPLGSLTWRLALVLAHLNQQHGIAAAKYLWDEFNSELRYRWENGYMLPCLEKGYPNYSHSILHQKFQMLNCCIERKLERQKQELSVSNYPETASTKASENAAEESDDEQFFECSSHQAEGRLSQFNGLTLLNSDEPLYIPIVQQPAPMTEDQLADHAEVLMQLGENAEGAALRARMQSASLMSDMEAFKAANPGCVLEDFVRWYSPRDWVQDGDDKSSGSLSSRMQTPGNQWLEAWENAKPFPARLQRRLFDDTKEAEKVLHLLSSMKISAVISHIFPVFLQNCILSLGHQVVSCPKILSILLKAIDLLNSRNENPEFTFNETINLLNQVERILVQHQALKKLFSDAQKELRSEDLDKFILDLLEDLETDINGSSKGPIGRNIISHIIAKLKKDSPFNAPVLNFPSPISKEFILRTFAQRPLVNSTPTPQRMYCQLNGSEFRLAGAFTEITSLVSQ